MCSSSESHSGPGHTTGLLLHHGSSTSFPQNSSPWIHPIAFPELQIHRAICLMIVWFACPSYISNKKAPKLVLSFTTEPDSPLVAHPSECYPHLPVCPSGKQGRAPPMPPVCFTSYLTNWETTFKSTHFTLFLPPLPVLRPPSPLTWKTPTTSNSCLVCPSCNASTSRPVPTRDLEGIMSVCSFREGEKAWLPPSSGHLKAALPMALGDWETLEPLLTNDKRPMAGSRDFTGEASTVWAWVKMRARKERLEGVGETGASHALKPGFSITEEGFSRKQKYNNPNDPTMSRLWLMWSVPTILPWIPLSLPPFITFLHTAPSVHSLRTACTWDSLWAAALSPLESLCLTALRYWLPLRCVHLVSIVPGGDSAKITLGVTAWYPGLASPPFSTSLWLFLGLPPNNSLSHESWSQVLFLEDPALCTRHRLNTFYALFPPIFKTTA